jgi:hypothetical protein
LQGNLGLRHASNLTDVQDTTLSSKTRGLAGTVNTTAFQAKPARKTSATLTSQQWVSLLYTRPDVLIYMAQQYQHKSHALYWQRHTQWQQRQKVTVSTMPTGQQRVQAMGNTPCMRGFSDTGCGMQQATRGTIIKDISRWAVLQHPSAQGLTSSATASWTKQ